MTSADGTSKKRKKLPNTPVDKNSFLPKHIKICGWGCGTPIEKDPEFQWIEYLGGRQHSRRRCDQVKQENKEKDKQNSYKKPRQSVVMNMEDRLAELKPGMNDEERLFHIIQYRTTEDDMVSKKEIALAMFPDLVTVDRDTEEKEPKHEAVQRVGTAFTKIRKNPKNKNVVSFAKKSKNGVMMYFNEQSKEQIIDAKRRMEANIEGRKNTMKAAEEIIDSGTIQRKINAKQFEKEIEKNIRIRTAKKKRKEEGGENN